MFGIGSRCFYAISNDVIFQFESKRDRDCFIDNSEYAKYISAKDAWDSHLPKVQVPYSGAIGANPYRKQKVKEWYENKRRRV